MSHIWIWWEVLGNGYESGFKKYGMYSLTYCPQWIWMRMSRFLLTLQVTARIRILDHSGLLSHLWFINRMLIFKLNRFLFQLLRNGLKMKLYIINTYAKNVTQIFFIGNRADMGVEHLESLTALLCL